MKNQKKKVKREKLSKYSFIFYMGAILIFTTFFQIQAIPYVNALSTGLKPGDVIVYDFFDVESYYNSNMTLLDYYEYQDKVVENITDIRKVNDSIEIYSLYRAFNMKDFETGLIILNSSSPLGMGYIPKEFIGFNFSDSAFYDYLNIYFKKKIMEDDRPEGNVTWNYKILANGLGFQINANYTNYKFNCTKEYNLTLCLYYSRSGVLLLRNEEFYIKYPDNCSLKPSDIIVLKGRANVNSSLSNFDGKNERPWDPYYIYPEDGKENRENKFISLTPLEFGSVFVITIFFLTRKGKNHH
ncbi:hypothetical protein [Candidatus Harpocratesius sp.]